MALHRINKVSLSTLLFLPCYSLTLAQTQTHTNALAFLVIALFIPSTSSLSFHGQPDGGGGL